MRKNSETESQPSQLTHESQLVSLLISAVSNKNYAEANKYLNSIIVSKIQSRISKAVDTPLF